MNETLKYLIESSIVISVFYLIYVFIYNGDKNSKFNRIYLISSSFLAVILPVLRFPVIGGKEIEYTNSLHHAIQLPAFTNNHDYLFHWTGIFSFPVLI
jgi:hypothetical protein